MVGKKEVAFALEILILSLVESGHAALKSEVEYQGKSYTINVKEIKNADSNTVS